MAARRVPNCEMAMLIGLENCWRIELADSADFYFADAVAYEAEAAAKFLTPETAPHLAAVAEALPGLADYSREGIEAFLRSFVETRGIKLKAIAQPLRVALTGRTVSPGIDEIMITLGLDKTLDRIRKAIAFIGQP